MKKSALLTLSALAMSSFAVPVNAWNALGHQVIAHIAYQQLEPQAKKKVDSLIKSFNQDYPDINSVEALSVWPDAIRSQKIETYARWHYIDTPIIEKDVDAKPDMNTDNAVWALQKIKPVVENNQANAFERARFLSFFIHIVGDLHQPLHTAALFSAKHPTGDRGGNDYTVRYHNKTINLHALWDRGVGAFEEQATIRTVNKIADTLMRSYPKAYFAERINQLDTKYWVDEGVKNATNDVYATKEGQPVSDAYIINGKKRAEEQATLAGYRLGTLLNQLLN